MTTTSRRRPTLATRAQPKETSGTASPRWRRDGRAVPRGDEHDRGRAAGLRHLKGRWHPRDVGQVARGALGWVGRGVAEVVARALDVECRVGDATNRPAAILDTGHETAHTEAQRLRLHFLAQPTLPERERRAEEDLPLVVEALARREASVRRA